MARQIGHGEQQIAEFLRDFELVRGFHSLRQFPRFFCDFVGHSDCARPVKANLRRAVLQFHCARQRGEGGGHIVQQTELLASRGALLALDVIPGPGDA